MNPFGQIDMRPAVSINHTVLRDAGGSGRTRDGRYVCLMQIGQQGTLSQFLSATSSGHGPIGLRRSARAASLLVNQPAKKEKIGSPRSGRKLSVLLGENTARPPLPYPEIETRQEMVRGRTVSLAGHLPGLKDFPVTRNGME